jgi:hypothetical protein
MRFEITIFFKRYILKPQKRMDTKKLYSNVKKKIRDLSCESWQHQS